MPLYFYKEVFSPLFYSTTYVFMTLPSLHLMVIRPSMHIFSKIQLLALEFQRSTVKEGHGGVAMGAIDVMHGNTVLYRYVL